MTGNGGNGRTGIHDVGRQIRSLQRRSEAAVTRSLLLGIFTLGLIAQFVPAVGDALEGKAFLGGALLSLVGYVLYGKLVDLDATLEQHPGSDALLSSPNELDDYYDRAFAQRTLRLCFIGYTGETVFNAFIQRLDRLSQGRGNVRAITIHVLVPDYSRPMAPPCRADTSRGAVRDDAEFRRHQWELSRQLADRLQGAADHLHQRTGVRTEVRVRQYLGSPMLKLYLLDDKEAFLGLYDELAAKAFPFDPVAADRRTVHDPQGYDTALLHWHREQGEVAAAAVRSCALFFANRWQIAEDLTHIPPEI